MDAEILKIINESNESFTDKELEFIKREKSIMPYVKFFRHNDLGLLSYTSDDDTFTDMDQVFYDGYKIDDADLKYVDTKDIPQESALDILEKQGKCYGYLDCEELRQFEATLNKAYGDIDNMIEDWRHDKITTKSFIEKALNCGETIVKAAKDTKLAINMKQFK